MGISLYLPDLMNGKVWTYNVEFYLTGDLKGYIQGEVHNLEINYKAEFLFRVRDDENGKPNTMVSFSCPPTKEEKAKADMMFDCLEKQLTEWSNACNLREAVGKEIPDEICYADIKYDSEDKIFFLNLDGSSGYPLNQWKIKEAIDYYCTDEAKLERDIATREAWGFYD